jgi:cytochrome c oxidase subunit 2
MTRTDAFSRICWTRAAARAAIAGAITAFDACGSPKVLVEGANTAMRVSRGLNVLAAAFASYGAGAGVAHAGLGQPSPWQLGLQQAATGIMDSVISFHNFLLVLITLITLFVLSLLVWVMIKFNAKANPIPSRTTHNTLLEVLWTVVPVLILVSIAVPSFRLLFHQLEIPKADVTVKATGKQWFWTYTYPDYGPFEFDSLMLKENERKADQPRLLAVDNEMVVPVNEVVRVLTTGADVIHSFAVPSFGIKIDAIPGRINETWFKATKEGMYYGQCSELCGRDHAFMPIAVRVVSEQAFAAWIDESKKRYAGNTEVAPANAVATAR